MKLSGFLSEITKFNSDKNVIKIREKYDEPSFFQIISKERSETTYSSFLKWLFQDNWSSTRSSSFFLLFLDLLVKKSEEKQSPIIEAELKKAVLTRSLSITSLSADIESMVSVLAGEAETLSEEIIQRNKQNFEKTCKDRIDLFIRCAIDKLPNNKQELQIILENKIDSAEEGKKTKNKTGIDDYDNKEQTKRYYIATKRKSSPVYQIYVYLTPDSASDPTDIEHWIHITYQELLDNVINPMMSSSSLSDRARFFIEEFKNQLVFPTLEGDSIRPSIAVGHEQSDVFDRIFKDNQDLIIAAILSSSDSVFWNIGDEWFSDISKEEILTKLNEKKKNELTTEYITNNGKWKRKMFEQFGADKRYRISGEQFTERDLLEQFWSKNKRFLTAILNGISEKDCIQPLLNELNKRDTTKYTLIHNGVFLKSHLGKRALVLEAFRKMVNERINLNNKIGKRVFYYNEADFKVGNITKDVLITDDMVKNRYSLVSCNTANYYVLNQWGVGKDWNMLISELTQKGFSIIEE